MDLDNADFFYCSKCRKWFHYINLFEEHCARNDCTDTVKKNNFWNEHSNLQKKESKLEEDGIVLYLHPIGLDGARVETDAVNKIDNQGELVKDATFVILICGQCRNEFQEIDKFKNHYPCGPCATRDDNTDMWV